MLRPAMNCVGSPCYVVALFFRLDNESPVDTSEPLLKMEITNLQIRDALVTMDIFNPLKTKRICFR
jgi:hypothetical protein